MRPICPSRCSVSRRTARAHVVRASRDASPRDRNALSLTWMPARSKEPTASRSSGILFPLDLNKPSHAMPSVSLLNSAASLAKSRTARGLPPSRIRSFSVQWAISVGMRRQFFGRTRKSRRMSPGSRAPITPENVTVILPVASSSSTTAAMRPLRGWSAGAAVRPVRHTIDRRANPPSVRLGSKNFAAIVSPTFSSASWYRGSSRERGSRPAIVLLSEMSVPFAVSPRTQLRRRKG
mmetsp:Transcript_6844/g.16762  ORF Transcript_6844/g.16762 Transcript_6844/m.16762 type:complete len:236 (+) Transcript_6844:609-1316(+)